MSSINERKAVTRLDPAVRRVQILEAATKLFEHRDPLEVPFEEIAEAAGVSRALVYNYFGDRAGLLAAVYLHNFEAVRQHLAAASDPSDPPAERMRSMVSAYLDFAASHPGPWHIFRTAVTNTHPDVVEVRERTMLTLARSWGGSTEARIVAYTVVGMLEAATVDWLRSTAEVDKDHMAEVLFDLMWKGLSSLGPHGIAVPEVSNTRSRRRRPLKS